MEQKRGLILLRAYQQACRKFCGGGFRADPITDASCTERTAFKQSVTVARWLAEEGLRVGVQEPHWESYVDYAFEHYSRMGQVPAVGQLKNIVLLKKFYQHSSVSFAAPSKRRSDDQLEQIYARVLDPELARNVPMLHLLGLLKSDRTE